MKDAYFDRLVILEMANNHMGNVEHGLQIIDAFADVRKQFPDFRFAIKFQYRDLDSFIHPDYQGRMDIKYIKRFSETRLTTEEFAQLKKHAEDAGFLSMCTPFDEVSVRRIAAEKFHFLKVASCSFSDWPLWEEIAKYDLPLVVSTAGASLQDIDNVVSFLQHRNRRFALMHCVGAYPTPDKDLELNQIDFFNQRYPEVPIGFSTHEAPEALLPAVIAVAKGACILERHVGLPTEKYSLNAYSSTPEQVVAWLENARKAYDMCGVRNQRRTISAKEAADLRGLQRGAFAARTIDAGEKITQDKLFFAIPNEPGQFVANDLSKYLHLTAQTTIQAGSPVRKELVIAEDVRKDVVKIITDLCGLIKTSGVQLANRMDMELSHHYGLEKFYDTGCAIITCVNREYCKKILLVLPGQKNPNHLHQRKEEMFYILYGELELTLGNEKKLYRAGDSVVVERGVPHEFSSPTGAVFEEISSTHYLNDSFYDDPTIAEPSARKTYMTFYADWLTHGV